MPPLITFVLILIAWQILCSRPGATLPSPTVVWSEAGDLIRHPFFNNGPQDIGLGWRVLVSVQRVMVGFGFAAVVGVLLGTLVGQSVWAMRGLDPIFQVLRTVPPLAWLPLALAAFRDSNPSAIFVIFITSIWPIIINTAVGVRNIPQDYRNVAKVLRLNPFEFFTKIMVPSAAPYIFTGLRIGIGLCLARNRGGGNADRRCWHRLLHLGRLEFLAAARHHRRARLHRGDGFRTRPHRGCDRQIRYARHRCKLKESLMARSYLKIDHVTKCFSRNGSTSEVLKDVDLAIERGQFVSIIGHSGCGKSTLLNLVAGLTGVD